MCTFGTIGPGTPNRARRVVSQSILSIAQENSCGKLLICKKAGGAGGLAGPDAEPRWLGPRGTGPQCAIRSFTHRDPGPGTRTSLIEGACHAARPLVVGNVCTGLERRASYGVIFERSSRENATSKLNKPRQRSVDRAVLTRRAATVPHGTLQALEVSHTTRPFRAPVVFNKATKVHSSTVSSQTWP